MQEQGRQEIENALRNSFLYEDKEELYVDPYGNLLLYINDNGEEDVWYCDGLVTANLTGVELIYFFEYNEDDKQDYNGGI